MFDRLFQYPRVIARHREGPMLLEREQYLQHCADQGMAQASVIQQANELLVIVQRLDLVSDQLITRQQIAAAATRWARYQRRRGRCRGLRWPRERFMQVAKDWLIFMDRLQVCSPKPSPGAQWIEQFVAYMRDERGLSSSTIHDGRWHTEKFFKVLAAQGRTLIDATIIDVDKFLESLGEQGWCRVSLVKSARTLRAFFRYAEHQGWCKAGIAAAITGPRVFRDEGLPVGPDWTDVERLIRSTAGDGARDIRDRAILQLLAIYGWRSGEVAKLRIEDLNWAQERILVSRLKQRRRQEYPLAPVVGDSILRYLEQCTIWSAIDCGHLRFAAFVMAHMHFGMRAPDAWSHRDFPSSRLAITWDTEVLRQLGPMPKWISPDCAKWLTSALAGCYEAPRRSQSVRHPQTVHGNTI